MAIIEPMIRQAGFDMIWFGIFLVVVVEMAQITPPVGFNLFVLQGMANKDMGYIARSAFPLFLLMILAVIVIIIFPEIAYGCLIRWYKILVRNFLFFKKILSYKFLHLLMVSIPIHY